jgi:hypothetical protein
MVFNHQIILLLSNNANNYEDNISTIIYSGSSTDPIVIPDSKEIPPKKLTLEEKEDVETNVKEQECVICLTNKKTVAYQPCNHLATCNGCARGLLKENNVNCPLCQKKVENMINLFV